MDVIASGDDVGRSDESLVEAIRGGDQDAFEELVRRYQGRLFSIAYRMTLNREDALDVTQEALLKAYRKIDRWKPTGSFSSWLIRLAVNQSVDHLRRRKRHQHAPLDVGLEEGVVARDSTGVLAGPDGRAGVSEIDERVHEAMNVLTKSQRTVFVLRHYEGMALADIAPVLGCSIGSVKVHLFRALRKLRPELRDIYEDGE